MPRLFTALEIPAATGQSLAVLLRDRLLGPIDLADELHFAVPPDLLSRVVCQVAPPGAPAPGLLEGVLFAYDAAHLQVTPDVVLLQDLGDAKVDLGGPA